MDRSLLCCRILKVQNLFCLKHLDRLVCKELVSRSKFPILDVIEVIKTMSQPHLLDVTTEDAVIESNVVLESKVSSIVAPLSIYSN